MRLSDLTSSTEAKTSMQDVESGLRCPLCGSRTEVHKTDSRVDRVRRKRRCLNNACRHIFSTVETLISIEKSPVTPSRSSASGN